MVKPYRMSAQQFSVLAGPIVYVFQEHDKPLYVGMSRRGLSRPLATNHQAIETRLRATEVHIYSCSTPEEAIALERRLIRKHKPPFNKHIPATDMPITESEVFKERVQYDHRYETVPCYCGQPYFPQQDTDIQEHMLTHGHLPQPRTS